MTAAQRAIRVVGDDLSSLPDSADGPRSLVWWSNLGFMLIEGTGFALAAGAYLYLQSQTPTWPPHGDARPGLFWSTLFTVALLVSNWPNRWLAREARRKNERTVRWGSLGMTLVGALLAAIRAGELSQLNIRWDHDAYGSATWLLMLLHTTHILTELLEMFVVTLWLFTHSVGDDEFADVEDNANYWSFVVFAWLPLYGLVYWVPRMT